MALFSFHCQNYKSGALFGLDKHNRRLNKNYDNPNIDPERTHLNRIYVEPKETLYSHCKKRIHKEVIANGNRVRSDSNWICECIFSFPAEFPIEELDRYNSLIIQYMNARTNGNVVLAVAHCDEGGIHLHADILLITEDNRLSSKTLITRDFITSIHDKLPLVLQHHGFDVERGTSGKMAGLNAKEYKKKMEEEKKELDKKLDKMADEYNKLADHYNHLLLEAKALEERNIRKAKELLEERERTR